MIKNLELSFDRQEGEKSVFKTEQGSEIFLDSDLIKKFDNSTKLYLNLGRRPIPISEDQKNLLNELLEGEEK